MKDEVEILESIPTKIRYKDIVWIPEASLSPHGKQNYFLKWIMTKDVGVVFSINDFYKNHPKHKTDVRCKQRLVKIISDLIKDNVIQQMDNEGEFRRLK